MSTKMKRDLDPRIQTFLADIDGNEAIVLRYLLESLKGDDAAARSDEDLQSQFEKLRKRIKEIEERALRRLSANKEGLYCHICKSFQKDANRVLQAGSQIKICGNCIEGLYAKLMEH